MNLPIAKEGFPYIFGLLGVALAAAFFSISCALAFLFLTLLVLYFFRDPRERSKPLPGEILAPSYGTIVEISQEYEETFLKRKGIRVGIFLSVFDVHMNYAPTSGIVTHLEHKKGKFINALKARAALVNECNWLGIQGREGVILVKQIAGMIARRIVCSIKTGAQLQAGEKIGLIQFGSRVDIWLPHDIKLCVCKGERVRGGITVIGVCSEKSLSSS